MNIEEKVYNFKTKNREGFTQSEIETLLKDFPGIKMKKFNQQLNGITVMEIDNEIIIYHIDILHALMSYLGDPNSNNLTWD